GEWVNREVCLALKRWGAVGLPLDDFAMHINLSGKQLLQQGLPQRLAALLAETGVAPGRIVLELTESSIMESAGQDMLESLRQVGVSIAIDDFGTGHSSLSYLHRFPFDTIKIPAAFVQQQHIDTSGLVKRSFHGELVFILGVDGNFTVEAHPLRGYRIPPRGPNSESSASQQPTPDAG
ncbi:MAG TPA: EAL domain-containing protein, partial [Opitutus sp.]|nr:EAL domain-containing protein [Opitutus sp.]